jgi:hypothetical protein
MDATVGNALELLRTWSCEDCRVRFAFFGRGLEQSFSAGAITDVSGNIFTFKTNEVTVRYDVGVSSSARFIPLGESPIPEDLSRFCDSEDESAVVFSGGACNDTLILIKKSDFSI